MPDQQLIDALYKELYDIGNALLGERTDLILREAWHKLEEALHKLRDQHCFYSYYMLPIGHDSVFARVWHQMASDPLIIKIQSEGYKLHAGVSYQGNVLKTNQIFEDYNDDAIRTKET